MAANLIYLKSRSLLPVDQQPPDEDAEEDDPRWDLIRQLIEYKKFKEAAAQSAGAALWNRSRFSRAIGDGAPATLDRAVFRLGEVGIFQLINAFQTVLKRVEAREDLQEIFGEHFTVSDKIEWILQRVSGGVALHFSELFADRGLAGRDCRDVSRVAGIDPAQTGSRYAKRIRLTKSKSPPHG